MKKIVLIAAIGLLLPVGGAFLLPLAASSDGLRTALSEQLSRVSGAQVALNGPIHFSVLPDFGVVVEDFGYATLDGNFEVTAERSVASVALLPLLSGQIQITGIELRSPRILLTESAAAGEAEAGQAPDEGGDLFKTVASYLENVSIDHITVIGGEVLTRADGTATTLASDIDMRLSIPGITAPASLALAATLDGNRMELGAEIGSLRDLLARQPARFVLSTKATRPAHPALADLKASGSVQLAEDGSYRIAGGEIDSIGQKMALDVNYAPGERPSVVARIKAGSLAYADLAPEATGTAAPAPAAAEPLDLSILKTLDADVELYAEALSVGEAVARDVVVAARLIEGKLIATVDSTRIAGGSLVASMALDANVVPTVSSGSLNMTSIDIGQLMALIGQDAPVRGALSSELQYAFKGMEPASIRNSLNLRGTASIAQGRLEVPQLVAFAGPGAGVVDGLSARVDIVDITKPLAVSGSARWNGEPVEFTTSLTATDLLWEQDSTVAVTLQSNPVNAGFSGTLTPAGQVSGKADIQTPSLERALAWMGQTVGTPLGRFAFSGGVSVGGSTVALTDANIQLDDISASGAISLAMTGKPTVTANLSVDRLDFAALVGSGGTTQTAATSGPAPIDLSMLRLFNADIRLAANQLGYGKVRMGPATAALSVTDGVARLTVPQAAFYDGTISADITANGAGSIPAISVTAGMEGVQALALLTDAAGFDRIEGRLKASMQVAGSGADSQVFASSLNGPVNLVVTDGALRGIDVAGLVRNVRSLIGAGYAQDANARTEFSELSVPVTITDGVARADDIRVLGPFLRMSGAGTVDLAGQSIDMRLDPRVVGSLDGQGGEFDVSGLGMPIMVTGPLSGPSIYPDLSSILADPGRALQALTALGGRVGDLAGNASGLIEGLGTNLGGETGGLGETLVTDAIGQMLGAPGTQTVGAPTTEQTLLNTVLGSAFGQQASGVSQEGQPLVTAPPATPAQANVPLPRPDPRGPAPVATAPSVPAPAPQPDPAQQMIDLLAPQQPPAPDGGNGDPLEGLFDQLGF